MATATALKPSAPTASEQEKKIAQFRELFADAPEVGKKAIENALRELKSQLQLPPAVTPGRAAPSRQVSERRSSSCPHPAPSVCARS